MVLAVLLCSLGVPAHGEDAGTRAAQCREALQADPGTARTPEAERRLRQSCYEGARRAPLLRPPIAVDGTVPPVAVVPMAPALPAITTPAAPAVLTQCDAGGCWDQSGQRYNGSGSVYSGPGGAVCMRNGDRIECR